MAFSNPIIGGGGALIREAIQSPDYVAGVSGWTINRDGTVEFSDGTFRGAVDAAVISGSTIVGSTVVGGTIETATSGERVVMSSFDAGRIDFYSALGDYGYITTSLTGGTNEINLYNGTGNCRVLANNTTASLNSPNGVVSANSSGGATMQALGGTSSFVSVNNSGTTTVWGTTVDIGSGSGSDVIRSNSIYSKTSTFAANVGIATSPLAVFYRLTSSARYKVEIHDVPVTDDDVRALRAVTYYDRGQAEEQDGQTEGLSQQIGLIAEEVHASPLGHLLAELDEDGRPESVNYERVGVALIPVVQRLLDRVETLEREITALKGARS